MNASGRMTALLRRVRGVFRRAFNRFREVSRPAGTVAGGAAAEKLHVGCGSLLIPGFLNIDAQALPGVDLVCNLLDLDQALPPGKARLIYACHVLEHFSTADTQKALEIFYRLLAPGGEVRISVPDLDIIVREYVRNWEHFQTPGNSPWVGLIYGGQTDAFDFHKTGFNYCWLAWLLQGVGFREVSRYPHQPHFLGIRDASLANEPFGEFLSLNVRAVK